MGMTFELILIDEATVCLDWWLLAGFIYLLLFSIGDQEQLGPVSDSDR